ncbi:MAG TPA: tetratricopeptide repeat protein [Pseudolabrys sp.]
MTFLPFRLKRLFVRKRARSCPRINIRQTITAIAGLAFACVLASAHEASADDPIKGEVKAISDGGFVRLLFHFDEAVEATVRVSGAIIIINFKKPVAVAVEKLNAAAPDYVSAARRDPDGGAIRIALTRKAKVNTIAAAERLYIDLLPDTWKGAAPGLPQEVIDELVRRAREAESQLHQQRIADKQRKPPVVRVKVAVQPTFIRYTFTMPGTVNVVPERADGRVTLNFDQQVNWDLADAKASLPATVKSIESEVDFEAVAVVFTLNGTPQVRTFREDRSIIVDIGTDGAAKPKSTEGSAKQPVVAEGAPATVRPETKAASEGATPADPRAAAAVSPAIKSVPVQETPVEQAKRKDSPAAIIEAHGASPSEPKEPAEAPSAQTVPAASPVTTPASPALSPAAAQADAGPAPASAAPAEIARSTQRAPAAQSVLPAPNPNAVVVAGVRQSGETMRLAFPFAVATPAAVFQRAETMWLVFDTPAQIDLTALQAENDNGVREVLFDRAKDGAAIIRLKLTRPRMSSLAADGPGWTVTIADSITESSRPLTVARSIVGKNRASLAIPFDDPRAIHDITDPDVGDRLMIVTALAPARGFLKAQDFVELRALPSTHGIVVQPIADDITAELGADKISISRPAGLSLSATALGQQPVTTNFRAYTFDTQLWGYDRDAPFNSRQAELIRLAAAAPLSKRRHARLNLARFYLAKDMAPEAKAVLDLALSDQRGSEDVTGSVLTAVADVMLDRPEEALKVLAKPQVGNQQDAPVWRAIALARQGRWSDAQKIFKTIGAAIGALPIELQRMAMKEELRSAIELRDFNMATKVASEIETVGVSAALEPTINVLIGRLYEGLGRNEDALSSYRAAATSGNRRAAAQGRLREIILTFASGGIGRKDVINDLETLTTVWRGDETETEGLKVLAHLYTEDSRYRDAFHVMRTALLAHPNSDMTRKIQDEAAGTFESLFLGGKGEALPPIEALGLFYDFRELTPIGRRGDEMIRRLADRLVSVDLLDQAAELLQHQVDHRLQGAARAQVATRLAVVYLMNRKPDRALATLQATRVSDLSNDLRDQRLLLEARALSNIGRHELALELIVNVSSREAIRLRSDILWAARRWRDAGEQIELFYGNRWREFAPLNEIERSDISRAAICYALSEEAIGVARLREKYEAKFADGPDRRAFEVVTAPVGTSGTEFQDIAKKIASIDTLDAFLRDLGTRYPDASAAPAGEGATAAAGNGKAATSNGSAGATTGAETPNAASSPLPPKAPAGVPLKPDKEPTGSIRQLPKRATAR